MATVLITGGTGMIGKVLTKVLLEKGYQVTILTRAGEKHSTDSGTKGQVKYAQWDIKQKTIDEKAIAESDYIIHLAGAGVADKRWTEKRKAEIVNSRVESGKLLVDSLGKIPNHIKAVVSASAIGWYGADLVIPNPKPFVENDPADDQFLGETCKKWEAALEPVTALNKRLVKLRTGIVLSKSGGALEEFKKPLKFGVAAILGNGKQIISWIHVDDLVNMYVAAIENEKMSGPYNAVAPNPVSNKILAIQLGKLKGFYIPIHVPVFILKTMLGEMSIEVLKSATVSSKKVEQTGFAFQFPTIETALQNLK